MQRVFAAWCVAFVMSGVNLSCRSAGDVFVQPSCLVGCMNLHRISARAAICIGRASGALMIRSSIVLVL